jgi:hypothetical protein
MKLGRTLERILRGGGWLLLGVIVIGLNTSSLADTPPPTDHRSIKLEAFFRAYQCPEPHYVDEYLQAADLYDVDYRLLPALSVRESTCGRHDRNNNHWGWASARKGFASVPRGIEFVTRKLAHGRYYKDKTLDGKLFTYNPIPQYVNEIKRLMQQIDDDAS